MHNKQKAGTPKYLVAVAMLVALWIGPLAANAQQREFEPEDWWGPRTKDWNEMWPGDVQRDQWGPGRMGINQNQRMLRHWTFMVGDTPAEYHGATSPVDISPEMLEEGANLYTSHCTRCHGVIGYGDGREGYSLVPSPALLAYLVQKPIAVDEYLLWSISDGGEAFRTEMPAFKDTLSEQEIWAIIAFMRAGFSQGHSN